MTALGILNDPMTTTVKVMRGARARIWSMAWGRIDEATLSATATVIWPIRAPWMSSMSEPIRSKSWNTVMTWRANASPTGVNTRPVGKRWNSGSPDFLFQLDDLPVHRRRSDVELSRRLPDRFGAAHGIEIADRRGMDAQGQKSILIAP